MDTKDTYYTDLMVKYFSGEASPENLVELENWVRETPANQESFQSFSKIWKAVENSGISQSIDVDREWDSFKMRLLNQSSVDPPSVSRVMRPASYLLLRIAAIFLILLVPAFLIYRSVSTSGESVVIAGTDITECTLPDGTTVFLNKGATLTYPERFDESQRLVKLSGEAWFDVAHDASHPFVVAFGKTSVQVLGTTFSVNSNAIGGTKEVILETGRVKIFMEDLANQPVYLIPGEKASISENSKIISKTINGDANFLAWKTKHLVFSNTPLREVAAQLSKVYHLEISISGGETGNCKITATFDKQSLESVLNVLKATLDLQIRENQNGIEISGPGCK